MLTEAEAAQRVRRLQEKVKTHKRLAREHRNRYRQAAQELDAFREELAARGIGLILQGAEVTHGRQTDS